MLKFKLAHYDHSTAYVFECIMVSCMRVRIDRTACFCVMLVLVRRACAPASRVLLLADGCARLQLLVVLLLQSTHHRW